MLSSAGPQALRCADAPRQARILPPPAGVHAAQQAHGRGRRPRLVRHVSVLRPVGRLHAIEEPLGQPNGRRGDAEPGHLAALQGHEHPAGHGHVARRAGIVSPAAALQVLGIDDEIQPPLGRRLQRLVVRHAVGLAQGDRGNRLAVHRPVAQVVAVGNQHAPAQQVIQAAADRVLVLALSVRIAGAQERQQCQAGGRRRAGLGAGVRTVVQTGVGRVIEVPASVGPLMGQKPSQAALDRLLALRRAAAVANPFAPVTGGPGLQLALDPRIGNRRRIVHLPPLALWERGRG